MAGGADERTFAAPGPAVDVVGSTPSGTTPQRPHAFYFGRAGQLFGWFHEAQGPPRDVAVVLCTPLGHEQLYAHRSFRRLALELAAAGFPTLRFDYTGTGDSGDDWGEEGEVPTWLEDIAAAVGEARCRSDARAVALVGLRVGGTLAAAAAAKLQSVASLTLWAPCASGQDFIRSLRALAGLSLNGATGARNAAGGVEAGGFALSERATAALSALRLQDLILPETMPVRLVLHDDQPGREGVVAAMSAGGDACEPTLVSGYSDFMAPTEVSVLPVAAIGALVSALASTHGYAAPAPAARFVASASTCSGPGWEERPMWFGGTELFGIFSQPRGRAQDAPAVLFLNMGGDHHVGPHRTHVRLARRLAAAGSPSLRIDLAGLGDSPARPGTQERIPYPGRALDDVAAAINALRGLTDETTPIVTFGLCSGGYHGLRAAAAGLALQGVVAVNPQLYWSPDMRESALPAEEHARRAWEAIGSPADWARVLRGTIPFHRVAEILAGVYDAASARARMASRRLRGGGIAGELAELFATSVPTLLVYDEADRGLAHLQGAAGRRLRVLRARASFSLTVIPRAGHTFLPLSSQAALHDVVIDWIAKLASNP